MGADDETNHLVEGSPEDLGGDPVRLDRRADQDVGIRYQAERYR